MLSLTAGISSLASFGLRFLVQRFLEQGGTGAWRPQVAWSRAVTVPGTLDHDDAVTLRKPIHEAVDREVLDQGAVAVDEDQGLTRPPLDVVQTHAVHVEKATDG